MKNIILKFTIYLYYLNLIALLILYLFPGSIIGYLFYGDSSIQPNLKATDVYKTAFMLSQREYMLIKTTDPGSRYFLIKQGVNAVIAKVNLAGMDNVINILSGRVDTVMLLDQVIKKHGSDPKKWLPVFYEEVKMLG